ncbi:hypothetical protein ABTM55_19105, partial [Acinetobacter baumannii]
LTGQISSAQADKSYLKTTGASVFLSRQLRWPDDYFSLSTGLSYTRYKLVNYYISPISLPGFNNGYSNNLNFKVALQRNSAGPNPMFPSN